MAHTIREKTKLLNRVRRIRGQVDVRTHSAKTRLDFSTSSARELRVDRVPGALPIPHIRTRNGSENA
jgi:hypothetical protein